jgi:WD40 repeat protein
MVEGMGFFIGSGALIISIDLEGTQIKTFIGHTQHVTSLHQSVASELVSASSDGTARVWDIE